jgi:putative ATP-binding cassette transporter
MNFPGKILLPSQSKIFLSQRPYLIFGATLREQLYYPNSPPSLQGEAFQLEQERLVHCLQLLQLDLQFRFGGFDTRQLYWEDILSQGEQQRVALVRVLVQNFGLVFLDESTSALDVENETKFYRKLQEKG